MRGEILGFNAPIEQKDGLYYYSDMSYSLINIMIADEDLLRKVYNLLKEVSKKVSHPEMEDVLKRLGTVKVRNIIQQTTIWQGKLRRQFSKTGCPA